MKTPIGILADYVSERAVENCVNMFRKEQTRINPGKIGGEGLSRIKKEWKDSLDCGINANEIERLKIWHKEMHNIIDKYIRKYPVLNQYEPWGYVEGVNIQYYKPGGGYPRPHTERMSLTSSHRILAFMTYLTDTKGAGTRWEYLDWEAPCKKGLTLIWPVDHIYVHNGIISNDEDKMIITGWLGFNK